MHRTTIELDDKLLRTLKTICVQEGKRFKYLVLELLQRGLVSREGKKGKTSAARDGLKGWHTIKGALPAGIDPSDRSTYLYLLERKLP